MLRPFNDNSNLLLRMHFFSLLPEKAERAAILPRKRSGPVLQRGAGTKTHGANIGDSVVNSKVFGGKTKGLCVRDLCAAEVSLSGLWGGRHVLQVRWLELYVRTAVSGFRSIGARFLLTLIYWSFFTLLWWILYDYKYPEQNSIFERLWIYRFASLGRQCIFDDAWLP